MRELAGTLSNTRMLLFLLRLQGHGAFSNRCHDINSKQVTLILRECWTRGDRQAKPTVKGMVPTDAGWPSSTVSYLLNWMMSGS